MARLGYLGGLGAGQLVVRTWRGFRDNQLDARSAQFAYYAILSLAPLLILVIAACARLPLEGTLESLLEGAERTLPHAAEEVILGQVRDIQARSTTGLSLLALVVLCLAGTRLFLTVVRGLNAAYGVPEARRGWQDYGLALLLTAGAFLVLVVVMVLMVVGPQLNQWVARQVGMPRLDSLLYRAIRWAVVGAAVLFSTSLIFWLSPNVRARWRPLSPGSLFATGGWIAVTLGLRYYVENFARYNETYGALGGIIVLMVWLYATGAAILMGGQIDGVVHRARTGGPPGKEN